MNYAHKWCYWAHFTLQRSSSASQGRKAELLQMILSSWVNSLMWLLTHLRSQESWARQGVPSLWWAWHSGWEKLSSDGCLPDWLKGANSILIRKVPALQNSEAWDSLANHLGASEEKQKVNYPSAPTNGTSTLKSRHCTGDHLYVYPFWNYPTWSISSYKAARPEQNPNTLDWLQFFDCIYQYSLLSGEGLYFKSIKICT